MTWGESDVGLLQDPVLIDDGFVSVDPAPDGLAQLNTDVIADPAAAGDDTGIIPPDAQTFGGPIEIAVSDPADYIATDPVIDGLPVDGGSTDVPDATGPDATGPEAGVPDGAQSLGGAGIDPVVVTDDNLLILTGEVSTEFQPKSDTPVDPVSGETSADGATSGELSDNWAYELFGPIYDKAPAIDEATGTPIVYSMGGVNEGPGRSSDPLPFERTHVDPAADGVTAPSVADGAEADRTPVHFAAADTFHTGLDLL